MIRRQVDTEYWLIAQDDHAKIAGELARNIGNSRFVGPSSPSAILGITLHDCGWPIHDEHPTLNQQRLPRDVFESTREVGLPVWEASAERAAAQDAYAGLLVSLHSLALSVFATSSAPISGQRWDLSDPRARFEVNRFQHGMIELQEGLRERLGMRTDRPLKYGLCEDPVDDPLEQKLLFDFRWLQAMDQISLSVCCTKTPFSRIGPILPKPGAAPQTLKVARPSDTQLWLDPWPFDVPQISVQVPFRRLSDQRFADEQQFRAAYGAAQVEQFTATLTAHTIA